MTRTHACVFGWVFAVACDPGGPGTFPPENTTLVAENKAAGDPHAGRFPFERAVAGLPTTGELRATLITDEGEIHCRLLSGSAPLTVANFVGLARGVRPFQEGADGEWIERPFYDGVVFHRASAGQFVQVGRRGGEERPGFRIQDEPAIGDAFDKPGVMAMANTGSPDTAAAQFFITTAIVREFDGMYTIFGRCEDPLIVRALERRTSSGEQPVLESIVITRE